MSNCGERLREERDRLGFNQTAFGAIGGVQKQAQLKYEKGERFPDAAYLDAVAKAGADVQYIITGVRSSAALNADEERLVSLFRAAPLAVKAAVLGGLEAGTGSAAGKPLSAPKYALDFGGAQIGQVVKGMSGGVNIVENHRAGSKEEGNK